MTRQNRVRIRTKKRDKYCGRGSKNFKIYMKSFMNDPENQWFSTGLVGGTLGIRKVLWHIYHYLTLKFYKFHAKTHTVKLGFNDHGYNEFTFIRSKNICTFYSTVFTVF